MEVVFLTDIKGVARRGEKKNVSVGYYQNFLLPKGLAVLVKDSRAVALLKEAESKVSKVASEVAAVTRLARSLDGKVVQLKAKAKGTEVGATLFGAVREAEIATALGIEKSSLKMAPIKTVGEHQVKLELGHGQNAVIKVIVEG